VGLKTYPTLAESAWQSVFQTIPGGHGDEDHPLEAGQPTEALCFHTSSPKPRHDRRRRSKRQAPIPRLHLDPRESLADIEATKEAEEKFRRIFRDHASFEVTYEELVDPSRARLDALQTFSSHAVRQQRDAEIAPENLQEVIENYAEIRDAMRRLVTKSYTRIDGGFSASVAFQIADHGDLSGSRSTRASAARTRTPLAAAIHVPARPETMLTPGPATGLSGRIAP